MPDAGIGTLLSAGASIIGGAISGDAAKSAADTQAQSGRDAIGVQKQMYDQNRADLAPYRDVGNAALYKLSDYLGLSTGAGAGTGTFTAPAGGYQYLGQSGLDEAGLRRAIEDNYRKESGGLDPSQPEVKASIDNYVKQYTSSQGTAGAPAATTGSLLKPFSFDISQDPGYQFRLSEGERAITNKASAGGGISGSGDLSGATLKELLRYGSDYASGEYNAAFNRDLATKSQTYGQLTGTAGLGAGATNTGVSAGTATAGTIGNTITGIGNAQAAGQVGSANALSGAFGNAASGVNQAMLLKSIMPQINPGVSSVNSGVNLGAE